MTNGGCFRQCLWWHCLVNCGCRGNRCSGESGDWTAQEYHIGPSSWLACPLCNRASSQGCVWLQSVPSLTWLQLVDVHPSQILSAVRALRCCPSPVPSVYSWWNEAWVRERLAPKQASNGAIEWACAVSSESGPGAPPTPCAAFALTGLPQWLEPTVDLWAPFRYLQTAQLGKRLVSAFVWMLQRSFSVMKNGLSLCRLLPELQPFDLQL